VGKRIMLKKQFTIPKQICNSLRHKAIDMGVSQSYIVRQAILRLLDGGKHGKT